MDSIMVKKACEKHEKIVNMFFENDEEMLKNMVDKILYKLGFDVDRSDFYSLGNEIFLDSLCRYDDTQDFNGFLYSCLTNKFKTEMTRRNRIKRQADRNSISIDMPIGEDEDSTIGDMIASKYTVEKELFEENEEGYSNKMQNYLDRLSTLQQEVLRLISIGFSPCEIIEELHINKKMYNDCYNAIHSYRNIVVLM